VVGGEGRLVAVGAAVAVGAVVSVGAGVAVGAAVALGVAVGVGFEQSMVNSSLATLESSFRWTLKWLPPEKCSRSTSAMTSLLSLNVHDCVVTLCPSLSVKTRKPV
jgi:hypothetical protein